MPEQPSEHEDFRGSGFLRPGIRAWLEGEKTDVSQSNRNRMKHDAREAVEGAIADFNLLNRSTKVDHDLLGTIVRNRTQEFEETVHTDTDIKTESVESAAGVAEFLSTMFAGDDGPDVYDTVEGGTRLAGLLTDPEFRQELEGHDALEANFVGALAKMTDRMGEAADVPKAELVGLVQEMDKGELIREINRQWPE